LESTLKIVAIVQARMGSTRLPNKVMMPICGVPMIELLLDRLANAQELDQIIVATTEDKRNNPLIQHVKNIGYACEQGSENDVLDRFVCAAHKHQADIVVRITGDCPLLDPVIIDNMIVMFKNGKYDYITNSNPPTFPDGLDAEVMSFYCLEEAHKNSFLHSEREHVTPYLRAHPEKYRLGNYASNIDLSHMRWTVDEPEDFEFVSLVYHNLYSGNDIFSTEQILALLKERQGFQEINSRFERNEGYKKSFREDAKFLIEDI
jgi:glutamate-1-semialdehyde 2,1-aminomutase